MSSERSVLCTIDVLPISLITGRLVTLHDAECSHPPWLLWMYYILFTSQHPWWTSSYVAMRGDKSAYANPIHVIIVVYSGRRFEAGL